MIQATQSRRPQILAGAMALVLLLGGCGTDGDPAEGKMTIEQLAGSPWRLVHMSQAGEKTVVPQETKITLRVEADGRLSGRSAVNRYSGQLKISEDGSVTMDMSAIASTRMAGPPELMALEQAYLGALGSVSRARHTADTLTLLSDDGATILHFGATE